MPQRPSRLRGWWWWWWWTILTMGRRKTSIIFPMKYAGFPLCAMIWRPGRVLLGFRVSSFPQGWFPQKWVGVLLELGTSFPICSVWLLVKGLNALYRQFRLTQKRLLIIFASIVRGVLDYGCLFLPSSGCLRAVYGLHPWWFNLKYYIVVYPVDTPTYKSFSKVQSLCIFTVVLFGLT